MTVLDDTPLTLRKPPARDDLPPMPYPDYAPTALRKSLRPYSAWPRCTRYLRFRQTVDQAEGRVRGSWTFTADWLASHVVVGALEGMAPNPWDLSLEAWLGQRDNADERVTALPDDWAFVGTKIAVYMDDDECRPFCIACGRNVLFRDLGHQHIGAARGDQRFVTSCPAGHVLLDYVTHHTC